LLFLNRSYGTDTVTIAQNSVMMTADKLGQSYLITPEAELLKFDADGNLLFRFFDRTLGTPTDIDATNPFQVLLFYADFQTILLLDRTLNPISRLNLSAFGFFQLQTVCMSNDNNLWIFDNTDFKLKKINAQGQELLQSVMLNELLSGESPNFLVEHNNRIYLNDPQRGILIFDNFGQYSETLPLLGLQRFQLLHDELFYQKEGKLWRFHLQTLDHNALETPMLQPNEIVFLQKNQYILWRKTAVQIIKR
jgi:hypothetical protein